MSKQETVRLLILDTSENHAEELVNLLRNQGYPTQAQLIESEPQLTEVLNSKQWDLCFCDAQCKSPSPEDVIRLFKQKNDDIATLLIAESPKAEQYLQTLDAGYKDLIDINNPQHLLRAAVRELESLYQRRDRRKAEINLRDAEKRCRLLLESSKDAIAYVHEGMHIYANPVYCELFGFSDFEDLEGMPLMDMIGSDDQSRFKDLLKTYSNANAEESSIEFSGLKQDGTPFKAHMTLSSARYDGESCLQLLIRTEARSSLESNKNQDIVTALLNENSFKETVDLAIQRAIQQSVQGSLLYLQIDQLAELNGKLPPSSLNLLLGDISRFLREKTENTARLGRVNELDFAILLPDESDEQALSLAQSLCQGLKALNPALQGSSYKLTASIGVTPISESAESPADLINKARESALYVHQNENGDGFKFHSPDQLDAARAQQVEQLLNNAIENDSFRLAYQPIVSLRGDSGEHYEVLIRMDDEEGKEISPSEFLHKAHLHGMSKKIDRWVIEHATKRLSGHLGKGNRTHIFINITEESLTDAEFLPWLSDLINGLRLPGDSLIFQISETVATAHLDSAKEFVKQINKLHCKVAITHFGRALNPFNTLRHLPASFVKIDSSYITDLERSEEGKEDIKTLVSSLHTQGKLTIAPFVDSASLLPVLWQAGINYIQGYYIQKPSESMDYDFSADDDD